MSTREAGATPGLFSPGNLFRTVRNRVNELDRRIIDGMPPALGVRPVAAAPPAAGRTIYVLHSGMRDPDNEAALSLKAALKKRGIKDDDMVVMPAVYPMMNLDPTSKDVGDGVRDNIRIFDASSDKNSDISQKQYKAYQDALKKAGAKPGDKIVWVGDSAGGQMGFTMARLAKDKKGFEMDTIVTLGSPIATNDVPPEVKIRHYTSTADQIQHGKLLGGQVGKPIPDNLDTNDKIRWFRSIGHCDWYKDNDPAIVDRIVGESKPDKPSIGPILATLPIPGFSSVGSALSAVESRNSFENNRGVAVPDNASQVTLFGKKIDVLTELDNLGTFFKKAPPKKATGFGQ